MEKYYRKVINIKMSEHDYKLAGNRIYYKNKTDNKKWINNKELS